MAKKSFEVNSIIKSNFIQKCKEILVKNIVTIIFSVICIIAIKLSGQTAAFLINEIIERLSRNSVLVLSLIIPVIAGIGLNFSIVLGAMAGQIALIMITHWRILGIQGIILGMIISVPIALFLGYLTAKLLNKTKGQEMITGMILGFFATGVYTLVFLVLVGSIIPMKDPLLILSDGTGIINTIELQGNTKYAIDNLFKLSLDNFLIYAYIFVIIWFIANALYFAYKYYRVGKLLADTQKIKKSISYFLFATIIVLICMLNKGINMAVKFADVPVATLAIVGLVCLLISFISNTKLGQDFRAVGQNENVASASGIDVNKYRILAILISTVLAAWGQIIFIQNMGNFSTYSSQADVGTFAIAALLVGGASVKKATIGQAIVGIILFHTLFIVSPIAGKNLFNDPQIGEYFRVFLSYGVIAVALGLHAWKSALNKKASI